MRPPRAYNFTRDLTISLAIGAGAGVFDYALERRTGSAVLVAVFFVAGSAIRMGVEALIRRRKERKASVPTTS
jgi:hypothetical protein